MVARHRTSSGDDAPETTAPSGPMTEPVTVLYVGSTAAELDSYLPATDTEFLGAIAFSADGALTCLERGGVDCLVVDITLRTLDIDSFLTAVNATAPNVPVLIETTPEAEFDVQETLYDDIVDRANPVEVRRSSVASLVRSTGVTPDRSGRDDDTNADRLLTGEDSMRGALDSSPVGIVVIADGEIKRTNQYAETFIDSNSSHDSACVTVQPPGQLYGESGNPIQDVTIELQEILTDGGLVLGYDPDGESDGSPDRWLLVEAERMADDEVTALIFKNVTWLREHQNELQRRRDELDETVAELRRSNSDLEQFAYVASHDLREPLRAVSNYLGLLKRRYGDELDEDAMDFVEYAIDGAQRMRTFINDLLEYSRVGREDEMGVVDLNDVVESVRSNLEIRLAEADADVTVEALPKVRGNAHRLEQLFQNLFTNAIKYAGETPPTITVETTTREQRCEVTVADDGIGIEPDDQENVFTPFYTNGNSNESTGIGLALCRKIVETHGGTLWLDSTPGEGTAMHFTLRVVDDAPN